MPVTALVNEKSPTLVQRLSSSSIAGYDLLNEPNIVSLRAGYLDHLTKMLTLAGETNAAARAKAILDRLDTPILGVVLNRTPMKHLNSYYKQYSAYYSG